MRLAPAPKAVEVVVDEVAVEVAVDTVVDMAVLDMAVVDDATSKCHLYKRRQDKT